MAMVSKLKHRDGRDPFSRFQKWEPLSGFPAKSGFEDPPVTICIDSIAIDGASSYPEFLRFFRSDSH